MSERNILSKKVIKQTYESYHGYLSEIMQNIVNILQSNIKLMVAPTYKYRVKGFESYYKKVLRVKPESISDTDSLIYLTDMMGIRMICAFLEDINIALDQIKKLFDIKEIEVKGAEKKFSEFGYESIHVLVKIPDECKPKIEGPYEGLKSIADEIVCEIQIRTILQDAWSEVEHELIYKTEFSPFDKPLRRKLASINASLTLADITFQEIRDYQTKLQRELDTRRKSFYGLADDLLNDKNETKAIPDQEEDISRVTPFVQGTIDDLILRAIQAHNNGKLDEAIAIYTRILDAISEGDENIIAVIRKHRGMAYFAKNNLDAALEDFNVSMECDKNNFRIYYYQGIVYSIQKKYENAVECFSKSLEINQFQAHTNLRRAMAYYELSEYEKSMKDLDTAIKLGMKEEEYKNLQEKLVKKFKMDM